MDKCKTCDSPTDKMELFPGGVCLKCYEKSPAGRYLPTAGELARMWGAS